MWYESLTPMTNSPRAVAWEAMQPVKDALTAYTTARNRKDFTAHQLLAVLALKMLSQTDYRGVTQLLTDLTDMRKGLGLEKVPHYSTLYNAASRLLKKDRASSSPPASLRTLPSAA